MAVPNDVTLRNFYGQYVMNKQLSDETDKVLQLVCATYGQTPESH